MQKLSYVFPVLCLFVFLSLLSACGSDAPADHSAALPHNMMEQQNDLSEAESRQLMEARGKSVQAISTRELKQLLLKDSSRVVAVNFWRQGCSECMELQHHLQRIQTQNGAGMLNILSLNLDAPQQQDQVNLTLRTAGITSPVFQLSDPEKLHELGIPETASGAVPALALFNGTMPEAFYQQSFTENELSAVLQAFLL